MRLGLGVLFIFLSCSAYVLGDVNSQDTKGLDEDLYSIAVSPFDEGTVFAGSNNALFRSTNRGLDFRKVKVISGDSKKINYILFDPSKKGRLFIACDAGLYVTDDLGETFTKIFHTTDEQGNPIKCLSLAKYKELVYLGTSKGLYVASQDRLRFRKIMSLPSQITIYDIKLIPEKEIILVATSQGVYTGKIEEGFKRTFITHISEDSCESCEEILQNVPRYIYLDRKNPSTIYLGTTSGLFKSTNLGKNWRKIQIAGLSSLDIRRIEVDSSLELMYLATDKGFYILSQDTNYLGKSFIGLISANIRDFRLNKKDGSIILATASGLYKYTGKNSPQMSVLKAVNYFKYEPSYREVQEVALEYNELHPNKTRNWRRSLKYRALFPQVSVDYDKTINYDSGADRYYVGPYDWGVSVSWDIGNLIWNTYEDDVDTRARLNTQTRLDILADIDRIYFERKRLKLTLLNNISQDEQKLTELQLQIEELTAALDYYTGGFFSRRKQELKQQLSSTAVGIDY